MIAMLLKIKRMLIQWLEWMLIVAVAVLVADVVWGVFSRYLLGHQSGWTEELARVLLIWVGLLGSSVAFGIKGHLGVDALVVRMAPGARRLLAVLVHLVVIFFAASVLIGGGSQLVRETFRLEQQMIAIPIPKAWVYMAIPISGVFTILFSLELIVETWRGGAQAQPAKAPGDIT